MREVWKSPKGQPFIVAGTGTLAMDMAAANLIEQGDNVLVISEGTEKVPLFKKSLKYRLNKGLILFDFFFYTNLIF
jgi:hypothetical protein